MGWSTMSLPGSSVTCVRTEQRTAHAEDNSRDADYPKRLSVILSVMLLLRPPVSVNVSIGRRQANALSRMTPS
eukprot:2391451-Rhodomonas_salina.1